MISYGAGDESCQKRACVVGCPDPCDERAARFCRECSCACVCMYVCCVHIHMLLESAVRLHVFVTLGRICVVCEVFYVLKNVVCVCVCVCVLVNFYEFWCVFVCLCVTLCGCELLCFFCLCSCVCVFL